MDTLKVLLSHDDVISHVLSERPQSDTIGSFFHGSAATENLLLSEQSSALMIKLYMDDFQTTNPLGNKTRDYKICGIYFTLANIPHHLASKVHTTQFAILAPHETISTHGLSKVMQPLIYDLKILETEGIEISVGTIKLRGSVCLIIADNLGAHEMLGFFCSFKFCRFCNISRNEKDNIFEESLAELRTEEN